MAGLLWPDADAERGRANLRQRLVKLRAVEPLLLSDDGRQLALQPAVVVDTRPAELLASYDYADCEQLAQWLDQQRQPVASGPVALI
jgi:hypothetical protein